MNHQFLGIVGGFLVLSGAVLYLLRNKLARAGVNGWAWLSRICQVQDLRAPARLVENCCHSSGRSGLVFLVLFLIPD